MLEKLTKFLGSLLPTKKDESEKWAKWYREKQAESERKLLRGMVSPKEAAYVRGVVCGAFERQADEPEIGPRDDFMNIMRQLHNEMKTANPESIKGIDTFGLVTESLGVIRNRDEMTEEVRDHGVSYANTRVIADIVYKRKLESFREWEYEHQV